MKSVPHSASPPPTTIGSHRNGRFSPQFCHQQFEIFQKNNWFVNFIDSVYVNKMSTQKVQILPVWKFENENLRNEMNNFCEWAKKGDINCHVIPWYQWNLIFLAKKNVITHGGMTSTEQYIEWKVLLHWEHKCKESH